MHAASVYPEPGSNSPTKNRIFLSVDPFQVKGFPARTYRISCHSSIVKVPRPADAMSSRRAVWRIRVVWAVGDVGPLRRGWLDGPGGLPVPGLGAGRDLE